MVVASVGSHGGTSTHIPIEVSALRKGIAYNVLINLFPKVDGTTAITATTTCRSWPPAWFSKLSFVKIWKNCDPTVIHRHRCMSRDARDRIQKLVGGPGFEPGASRSRTLRTL